MKYRVVVRCRSGWKESTKRWVATVKWFGETQEQFYGDSPQSAFAAAWNAYSTSIKRVTFK